MFCTNCGKKIGNEHKYCTNCGYENRNYHNIIDNKLDTEKDNKFGYFKKHWKGKLPLSISFWINNVFLCALLFLSLLISSWNIGIVAEYLATNNTILMFSRILFFWLFIYIFLVWALVGLWRSATKHIKRRNKLFWAYVSKIFVAFMVIFFAISLLESSISQLVDFGKLAFSSDRTPNYKIEMLNDNTIEISGGIKFGLANDIKKYFIKYPKIKIMILNSTGGSIYEAKIISKFLINKKITTLTTEGCFSSCVDIFMGGQQRLLYENASLGFHQVSYRLLPNMSKDIIRLAINNQKKYFLDRGVKQDFVNKAFDTPSNLVWYPSHLELIQAGVVSKVVDSLEPVEDLLYK